MFLWLSVVFRGLAPSSPLVLVPDYFLLQFTDTNPFAAIEWNRWLAADRNLWDAQTDASNAPISDVWMQFSLPVELTVSRRTAHPIMGSDAHFSAWWRCDIKLCDVTPSPEARGSVTWSIDIALDTRRTARQIEAKTICVVEMARWPNPITLFHRPIITARSYLRIRPVHSIYRQTVLHQTASLPIRETWNEAESKCFNDKHWYSMPEICKNAVYAAFPISACYVYRL